jgi:hypothetical protein
MTTFFPPGHSPAIAPGLLPAIVTTTGMSFLTHASFSVMLLLALLAGYWGHQRQARKGF